MQKHVAYCVTCIYDKNHSLQTVLTAYQDKTRNRTFLLHSDRNIGDAYRHHGSAGGQSRAFRVTTGLITVPVAAASDPISLLSDDSLIPAAGQLDREEAARPWAPQQGEPYWLRRPTDPCKALNS